jgi:ribosomal protein S18 acetylase RimI-like enzyme
MDCRLIIRPAQPDDCETIAAFNICLALETEGKQLDPATITAGVRTLLCEAQHGRYFVACRDSRIVGQMMHTREWSDWRNGEIWWLQSVYVAPDERRRGVFRALYRYVENLAENTPHVAGIRLYVEKHNSRAIDTYRSLGMGDAGYVVMERVFGNL